MVISGSVTLSIKLEAATRQEGKVWLAWRPPLDVTTQADTKQSAIASLKQAVELWFESCIARNVLEAALLEAGFCKMKPGETPPRNTSVVKVHAPQSAHSFQVTGDYIEVSIPAYIAAQCSADNLCAPR